MHNLDKLILEWRKEAATTDVSAETIDELETHLREITERLVRSGMSVSSAFQRAVTELGTMPRISSEFRKLDQPLWLPVKLAIVAVGVTALTALVMAIAVIGRRGSSAANLVLAAHVFVILLGYTITLLIGGLGICFVGQRCVSDFSPRRMHSLTRATFALGCVAISLTAAGIILGMIWAKAEWGRYWAWDAKEAGAFTVIVWQACFLIASRFASDTARGVLIMSVLGNIVVSLGWFGANLLHGGPHGYAAWGYWRLLLAAVVLHFAFFLIGLAPAGWLRLNKAP